ncbi:DgyrCDS9056 [Dimorphilus gyrociliatus]|uniref:5-formyltetrahydrofolate cyclo-ligase n=1 Tax=Dimorphilus gyrociliatus TaxID=2664684 RepID=A0A7I8VXG5_9ANNE|nr:DgyrCDS9056 [Dimorphilus gyrociliatus]
MPKYESFRTLVSRCNDWLRVNSQLKVVSCETFSVNLPSEKKKGIVNCKKTVLETGTTPSLNITKLQDRYIDVIKCFRVHLKPKCSLDSAEPDQIGYLNILPEILKEAGIFSYPEFSSWNDTLKSLNQYLKQQPISGRILCVQSLGFYRTEKSFDPEDCRMREHSFGGSNSFQLRLYYLQGEPAHEELGSIDFPPNLIRKPGALTLGKVEKLSSVVDRVQSWISSQKGIKVTNIQTINFSFDIYDGKEKVNTQNIQHFKSDVPMEHFVRVLRVYYIPECELPMAAANSLAFAAKKALRKEIKSRILALSESEKLRQSEIVTKKLIERAEFKNSERICVFLSMSDEIRTEVILSNIFKNNKKCFIPRYDGPNMDMVELYGMEDYDKLPETSWKIKQPKSDDNRNNAIDSGGLHLLLIPGLAFTTTGKRCGRGKGYYDNYLKNYESIFKKRPITIALAFKEQIFDDIPTTDNDMPIDAVLYEDK